MSDKMHFSGLPNETFNTCNSGVTSGKITSDLNKLLSLHILQEVAMAM